MKYYLGVLLVFLIIAGFYMAKTYFNRIPAAVKSTVEKNKFPSDYEISTWVWKSPDDMTPSEIDSLLANAKEEGFNRIFLSVGKYVDISEEADPVKKEADKNKLDDSTVYFLNKAHEEGISVEALAGNKNWAFESVNYIPPMLIDYVLDFNKRHVIGFSGIQFDIEFYTLPDYKENQEARNLEYLNLMRKFVAISDSKLKNSDLRIGVDLTYWLDNDNQTLELLPYKNKPNYVIYHVIDELSKIPNSYLVLMAYRDKTQGDGGVIKVVENEIKYIEDNSYDLNVVVALETNKNIDFGLSFFDKTKEDVKKAVIDVASHYGNYPLRGFAVHDFEGYEKLK